MILKAEQLTQPCVYKVLDDKRTVLYVGLGASGMGRVFDDSPDQKGRHKAFGECAEVELEFFSSKELAHKAEADQIHQLHPIGNAFCPKCGFYVHGKSKGRKSATLALFGNTRQKLFSLLLVDPAKTYHLREISRLTEISIGPCQRELAALVQRGILKRNKVGRSVVFQAEVDNPFFHELRSITLKS